MKNLLKVIMFISMILSIGSMTAFATNTKNPVSKYITNDNKDAKAHAYIEKSNAIRAEINIYTTKIKELREFNESVNAKLKELNAKYKSDKSIVSSDKMKQIKELKKSLQSVEKQEKLVTEDDSIKTLVKNKEYDKALNKLNETLEAKKTQLKVVQERNAIWHQIDALIG